MSRAKVLINKILELLETEQKFWDTIYKDKEAHWIDKNPSNLAKKAISKYDKFDKVLEIGCGAGIDTFLLATVANKITGIDLVSNAVDLAKKNLEKQPKDIKSKITFEVGDAEKLKYQDSEFDFVYSLSVLHSTDVNKSLKEVARVLKDDGKAVIYVYVGKDKEEIDEELFLNTCNKFFDIESKNKVDLKDKANDKHTALIVFLTKKVKK